MGASFSIRASILNFKMAATKIKVFLKNNCQLTIAINLNDMQFFLYLILYKKVNNLFEINKSTRNRINSKWPPKLSAIVKYYDI